MACVVPWAALVELIAPYYPEGKNGRPPFALETMLRVHFMQQWFSLSDPAMEEAFFDTPLYREFAQLDSHGRLPDESTILRFRHRLERHKLADQILATVNHLLEQRGLLLKAGTAVDATLIPAPSSTKNKTKERDPEMHSSQKGKQWYFGMKALQGLPAKSMLPRSCFRLLSISSSDTITICLKHGTDCTSTVGLIALCAAPDTNRSAGLHSHCVASI